jgi:CheY-like chemotaxis protein
LPSTSPSSATVDPLFDELARLREATAADPELREALCQVEASLRQAQQAAEGAARARGLFLSNMGHELRTPLNAILGFSQLLRQDRSLKAEHQTHVDIIHRSGEALLALINELLDISRRGAEDGRAGASFDLLQLADDLEDMLYLRAERRGLRLRVCRDPHLPRQIRVDGPRLRELFLLLLGNAIKFARPGELGLTLTCTPDEGDPQHGQLSAILAIPGLGTADLEALVRSAAAARSGPVVQATHASPRDRPLLGQELARGLGGALDIAPGELRLWLPVGLLAPADAPAAAPEPTIVGLAPGQPAYRILVAEDRWQSRQLLVQLLARVGFEVREASDGAEAMELWQSWRPQLIWMDMRMPGVTGLEATLKIKRSPGGKDTVIIALTASAFEEDPATARAAGCNDFVRKPIRMPEVFAKLREHLGVVYTHEAPGPASAAEPALAPDALARLPAPWLAALQAACMQADLDELRALIAKISAEAPATAEALDDLARRFNYDRILELTQVARTGD